MDHLKLKGDPKATRALVTNGAANDAILWSCAVTKINRKGKHQKRALLITNRHVLNLMPDNYSKCNRCIDLRSVHLADLSRSPPAGARRAVNAARGVVRARLAQPAGPRECLIPGCD